MYLRFLDMFFQDESFQQLENALDAGDLKDAFAAAHTLKGVAGNMGLTPFYEAVCVIVERLRTEEPRKDYPVLCKAIQAEFYRAELFRKQLKKGGGIMTEEKHSPGQQKKSEHEIASHLTASPAGFAFTGSRENAFSPFRNRAFMTSWGFLRKIYCVSIMRRSISISTRKIWKI